MSYTIEVDDFFKVIRYTHKGLIERIELREVWEKLLQLQEFISGGYGLLSDYRGSVFNFKLEETGIIDEFLNSLENILRGKKQSVIVDNPHATVISMIFQNKLFDTIGFRVKVFSTEKAAISWLVNPLLLI